MQNSSLFSHSIFIFYTDMIFTPELVPNLTAPASIILRAVSLSLIPPEAFTCSPASLTVSYMSFTSSTFAPTPFLTKPVYVLTKSAPPFMHNLQAFFISSLVNKSVSKITFKLCPWQANLIFEISSVI